MELRAFAMPMFELPLMRIEKFYCNNQCRWYSKDGFFDRTIQGEKKGTLSKAVCACTCVSPGTRINLGSVPYLTTNSAFTGPPTVPPTAWSSKSCCMEGFNTPLKNCTAATEWPWHRDVCHANVYPNAKPFDEMTWSDNYTTAEVCVLPIGATFPRTVQLPAEVHTACMKDGDVMADRQCRQWKLDAARNGTQALHCGACSSCSSLHDLMVLNKTKSFITTRMTSCSSSFVMRAWWTLSDLKNCLVGQDIDFSDDGRAWQVATAKPSCMDTWVDNIINDASLCTHFCLTKFLQSGNTGNFARDACLQCDEYTSGPAFIKGAGANRRSSGIVSDIDRTQLRGTRWEQKICKVGFFSD